MAIERKEIRIYIEKTMIFSIRMTYRSARDHPFVFSLLLFLLILYRTTPLIFSLLISSSPVIICTTLLLGLLLSYGEPNIPEIEPNDDEKIAEVSSTRVNDLYAENDKKLTVENHVEHTEARKDTITRDEFLGEEKATFGYKSIEEFITTTQFERDVSANSVMAAGSSDKLKEKGLDDLGKIIQKTEIQNLEKTENSEVVIERQNEGIKQELAEYDGFSSVENKEHEGLRLNIENVEQVHMIDSSLGSPWQHTDRNVEYSDFESDDGESSSPDASMVDIIPMLDELSPLLDSEHPQDIRRSKDDSDAASQDSLQDHELDDDSVEEEAEAHEAEEDEAPEEKDNDAEGAVKWTEDDQKNVMDLGSSEIERNRRLESLIARRRSRKNLTFAMDRSFIDLIPNDTFASQDDLLRFPANVPTISAPRRNPFDASFDQEEMLMPGSAPSSLLPRRNPFDILDDPQTEAGSFEQESLDHQDFTSAQHREMWFRRNETFNLDKREPRQVRRSSRFRPYFVPERMDSEVGSPSAFERQFSGKSDSKVSSVPESDTVSSDADKDYSKELIEEELDHEAELASLAEYDAAPMDQRSQSSDEVAPFNVELMNDNAGGGHEINLEGDVDSQEIHHEVYAFGSVINENKGEIYPTSTGPYPEIFELVDDRNNEPNTPSLSEEDDKGFSTIFPEYSANFQLDNRESVLPESAKVIYDSSPLSNSQVTTFGEASDDAGKDFLAPPLESGLQVDVSTNDSSPSPSASKTLFEDSWQNSGVTHENAVKDEVSAIEEYSKHSVASSATSFSAALSSTDTIGKTETSPFCPSVFSPHKKEDLEGAEPRVKDLNSTSLSISKTELMHLESGDLSEFKDHATTADPGKQIADHIRTLNSSDEESEEICPVVFEQKDIEETLLSELDAVGDFRTEGLRPNGENSELDLWTLRQGGDSPSGSSSLDLLDYPPVRQTSFATSHEVNQLGALESEYNYSFQSSDANFEQTVYNPKLHILDKEDDDSLYDDFLEPAMPLSFSESDLQKLVQWGSGQSSKTGLARGYLERTPTVSELPSLEVPVEDTRYAEIISKEYGENGHFISEGGMESKLDLHNVEATTLDDIHATFMELSNANAMTADFSELSYANTKEASSAANEELELKTSEEQLEAETVELQHINENKLLSTDSDTHYTASTIWEEHAPNLQPIEINSELRVVEATSLDDENAVFNGQSNVRIEEPTGVADGLLELKPSEWQLEPQILEVKHTEVNSLHFMEEVGETSSKVEEIKQHLEPRDTHSDLLVVEATSLDDIHAVSKELSDDNIENGAEEHIRPHPEPTEMHSDLHVVEATSLEDIHAIFKDLSDANIEKASEEQIRQRLGPMEIHSGLHVVEATSLDDRHAVFKELTDANIKKAVDDVDELEQKASEKPLESEPLQAKPDEEVSALPIVGIEATSQTEHDGDDNSSPSQTIVEKKKSRRSKSRSSSSSCSSSSSSDSD